MSIDSATSNKADERALADQNTTHEAPSTSLQSQCSQNSNTDKDKNGDQTERLHRAIYQFNQAADEFMRLDELVRSGKVPARADRSENIRILSSGIELVTELISTYTEKMSI